MKKIFVLTNHYMILTTPLVLFALFAGIYLIFAGSITSGVSSVFVLAILFAMITAFISGWGNMLKNAVLNKMYDEPYKLISYFTEGVGEYFLSSFGVLFISIVLSTILMTISVYLGAHFIGNPNISLKELTDSMKTSAMFTEYLKSLSNSQLIKLELWNLLLLCTVSISNFLVMLFIPAVFFVEKNPFKAFLTAIKNTFSKKIFKTILLFISIFCINFALSIFSKITASNAVLGFIALFANFYFICFAGIWIFNYYYENFAFDKV